MSLENDPSLMQDFLTEAAELIGKLDVDLVKLEETPSAGPESSELLNSIFRALHTVKGAAGFLGLEPLIRFAHAAEDALNKLRKGEVAVSPAIIDALLQSVDVLREMTAALGANRAVPECPESLLTQLHQISNGELTSTGPAHAGPIENQSSSALPAENPTAAADSKGCGATRIRILSLPAQKQDLLGFMVTDMQEAMRQIGQELRGARSESDRAASASAMAALAEPMVKTLEFFDLTDLASLVKTFGKAAEQLTQLDEAVTDEILARMAAVKHLVDLQAAELVNGRAIDWPLITLIERIRTLSSNQALPEGIAGRHGGSVETVLKLDGVLEDFAPAVREPAAQAEAPSAGVETPERRAADRRQGDRRAEGTSVSTTPAGDSTIRVEVSRLEALLNLVGQLVLNKNRVLGLSRRVRAGRPVHELLEEIGSAANELDRLTSSLQVGVMRTRMQPMNKLFERYPRVIRDIARATGKGIQLEVTGKETEVDKAVLELLADPLVHVLRNSADHGIVAPEVRTKAGKSAAGTIRLSAEHQGSHVRVEITDDGKGLDREVLGRKAVEKGLASAEQVAAMSESQVFQFIFAAGFSTAEKVSDLSGRGVGMDVVKTNVAKMGGTLNLSSTRGRGTTIEILIPLTVAIMPAMVVGVGRNLYAIPLTAITEIVRPQAVSLHSISGQPVMRLRDSVLPLMDLRDRLGEEGPEDAPGRDDQRFAVVVRVGAQAAGLLVDRLSGQQEVVIKPLDDKYAAGGPFSGATIREDGDVSLILDVIQLIRAAAATQAA